MVNFIRGCLETIMTKGREKPKELSYGDIQRLAHLASF
jgi:hypothetical protein